MAACIANSSESTSSSPFSLNSNQCQARSKFCRSSFSNLVSCKTNNGAGKKVSCSSKNILLVDDEDEDEQLWLKIREEALCDLEQEPMLSKYYHSSILSHVSLESALANQLAMKLGNADIASDALKEILLSVFAEDDEMMRRAIRDDLRAVRERDPACLSYVHCLLNFKGFLACQAHRVANKLWSQGRIVMAHLLQSRISEVFAVDIHPGARIGRGILLDHATGVVIGETAVIGDNVTILHNVTLGGTGKVSGDRHPKIGDGVFIGAGTKVLGNIRIGEGAKIGAGSVVLKNVAPKTTSVGNPARLVGGK